MYKKTVLPNGLRIITVPSKRTQSVTILVLVAAGSKYENKNNNGVSHFLEHMFFKGTKKRRSTLKIAEVLDKVGGAYNAFTGKEYTGYFAKVSANHFNLALDWVSDIFLNSKIEQRDINKEKGVIVEEINMHLDAPMQDVEDTWEELLYGDQPAGWRVIGTKENIKQFKRKVFIQYLKEHYSALNTIICLAGNFQEGLAVKSIEENFKGISTSRPLPRKSVYETQQFPRVAIKFKETDQTHLCLGVRGCGLLSPLKYAQDILAVILGGNMSSRLFIKVRGKSGLAYYVHTISEPYTDSGYLVTQAGVRHKAIAKTIALILEEYKSILKRGISRLELRKAKDYLRGVFTLSLEMSDAQASFYGAQELLTGHILTLREKLDQLERVSLLDVKSLSGNIFKPENLNLAMIGPHKDEKLFQSLLKIV